MSRSKKLVREFKGVLTGALMGFIYKALKGDRSGAAKIRDAAVDIDPHLEQQFDELEKSIEKTAKVTAKHVKHLDPERQKDLKKLAKAWESKYSKK
jgi:hypothetical protein